MFTWLKSFFGDTPTPTPAPQPLPAVYATERESLEAEFAELSEHLERVKARRRDVAARIEELNKEA